MPEYFLSEYPTRSFVGIIFSLTKPLPRVIRIAGITFPLTTLVEQVIGNAGIRR